MNRLTATDAGTGVTLVVAVALMLGLPMVVDMFAIMQLTLYVVLSMYAVSLAYIWGYGGIMCFGQSAFFGLGGYTFAVAAINMGDTTLPLLLAIGLPALFAAALGYFMFYGRLSDVYMGIVTLVVTLILYQLINQTAGSEYTIGEAALGGFNGIPSVPPLNLPGDPDYMLDPTQTFHVAFGLLILIYLGLKLLQRTHFGRTTVAIRESETRAALLGYDVRLHKVIVFTLGGAIAGLSGGLYAAYQSFIDPNAFTVFMSAQGLIWVMVGGLGTLVGPIIACCALQYLTVWLGGVQIANNNFVLGLILMVMVLVLPRGLLPSLNDMLRSTWRRFAARDPGVPVGAPLGRPTSA